ncbi:MAG: phage shock protein A [Desulfobacteraceae bacterium 4572_19]|nr:MAG: phage shock protein A [Desulfobacteraceae bacterium 4572_19]
MSFFKRLFQVGQSEAHAVIDKLEDPIKMTEQGIRDLKKDLQSSMTSLAQVKGIAIRTRKEADNNKKLAADYERKAMLLLTKIQNGEMDAQEAERLATQALSKKEEHAQEAARLSNEADEHEKMATNLQANVNKIKSTVTGYQNDLVTLKARARTAASTKKINAQLANVDTSGTVAMLEKMKAKVEEDESLAKAYGEMASVDTSVDDEIDAALGGNTTADSSAQLAALKKKMGM